MPRATPISSMISRLSLSSPRPATAPPASHQRGRCRSRAVVTQSKTAVQASRSSGVVLPMCTAPSRIGVHAVMTEASTRPNRPAPNNAANLAAMTTTAPPASAGTIRIAVGLTPRMPVIRVISGASGGWST